jgi:hypothetical protein
VLRQRLKLSLALALCFVATGAEWDVLQAFAWGRMMASYSRTEALPAALSDVFTGQMCSICRMVAQARAKEQQSTPALPAGQSAPKAKIIFFFQPSPRVTLESPGAIAYSPADARARSESRATPPVPPPRAELA